MHWQVDLSLAQNAEPELITGLANLVQHRGKGPCQKAKAKHDREARALKNVSIITFMKPKPKPMLVQSAIPHSKPIHSQKLPTTLSSVISVDIPTPSGVPKTINPAMISVHSEVFATEVG